MGKAGFYKIMFAAVLLTCNAASAQEAVWKKRVARIIDIEPKGDSVKHSNKDAKKELTLLGMIINEIKTGKLVAYTNDDNNFTTRLSQEGLEQIINRKNSVIVTNPIDNTEEIKISEWKLDLTSIHKYRILEEWVFDPYSGKTNIQITGIAPIKEIYGDDGVFRGVQALFWVRYNDVRGIIDNYERNGNAFTGLVWNDYFSGANTYDKVRKEKAIRVIELASKEDDVIHHLTDYSSDSSMYAFIVSAIKKGELNAYSNDNTNFTTMLSFDSLKEKAHKMVDTIMVTNPIDNTEEQKTTTISFEWFKINEYHILEEWEFDIHAGKTNIKIKGIAPIYVSICGGSCRYEKLLFWVNYNDLHSIAEKYNQYHPENSIAMHIWNDYFFSDIKPQVQK